MVWPDQRKISTKKSRKIIVAMPFISGMPGFCLSRRFH
jgi:hypothetical protein